MANEAFALSPISARASLPGEQDYEAIREAFMETSRGRWFLSEYARRNRNADTGMVLDAVARIEAALEAQKQEPPPPPPPVEDKRDEMLAAIGSAIARAEETASNALNNLGVEENLVPIRKGARIIKEISWRWREIGADGRICDLIDSQVSAIEAGCEQIAGADPRVALREAFEIIRASIEGFSEATVAAKADEVVAAITPAAVGRPAAVVEQRTMEEHVRFEALPAVPAEPVEAAIATAKPVELAAEADAYDEAVLDLVAAEMAAPDPYEADAVANKPRADVAEPPLIEPFVVTSERAPVTIEEAWPRPSPPVVRATSEKPSLGATILATGILPRPKPAASDPLAPIRRVSQAEKIAFFS